MSTARDFVPETRHATLTPGESLRMVRELQELSQSELARRSGIPQSAISAFESGAQEMGLKRVTALASALSVHPAVLAFPDWEAPRVTPARTSSGTRRAVKAPAPAKRAAKRRVA